MPSDGPKAKDPKSPQDAPKPMTLRELLASRAKASKERPEETERADRISSLQEKIDTGTYRVDFDKLSQEILVKEITN